MASLAEYITKRCEELRLTPETLALQMGVGADTVNHVLRGHRVALPNYQIAQWARALKVEPVVLYNLRNPPKGIEKTVPETTLLADWCPICHDMWPVDQSQVEHLVTCGRAKCYDRPTLKYVTLVSKAVGPEVFLVIATKAIQMEVTTSQEVVELASKDGSVRNILAMAQEVCRPSRGTKLDERMDHAEVKRIEDDDETERMTNLYSKSKDLVWIRAQKK